MNFHYSQAILKEFIIHCCGSYLKRQGGLAGVESHSNLITFSHAEAQSKYMHAEVNKNAREITINCLTVHAPYTTQASAYFNTLHE